MSIVTKGQSLIGTLFLQFGSNCLNKDHNCPFSHPLEARLKEAVAEEAGPNYKTKMCERQKGSGCPYGDRSVTQWESLITN